MTDSPPRDQGEPYAVARPSDDRTWRRERGIKTVAVTAGYMNPEPRGEFYRHIDAANIDLKAFTEQFYHGVCFGELAAVLDTLVWLKRETKVWFEVTTLLIPGRNDSEKEVGEMCDWFAKNLGPDVPLHFTAFHPDFKMLDVPGTPPATLRRAREQASASGLHYVYTGNVRDVEGQSTTCAQCGARLIERDGYRIAGWHLDANGGCESCGARLPGCFDARPGHWGSRRQPVCLDAEPSWYDSFPVISTFSCRSFRCAPNQSALATSRSTPGRAASLQARSGRSSLRHAGPDEIGSACCSGVTRGQHYPETDTVVPVHRAEGVAER